MIEKLTGRFAPWHPPTADFPDGLELDLGCGAGSFTVALAARYPQRLILGADVMSGRIRKSHSRAGRHDTDNVIWLRAEAWELLGLHLPDACLDRAHILCPDPWPKAKHRGNRLVSSELLARLATKIKPGGALHLATDDVPYRDTMLAAIDPLTCYQRDDRVLADLRDIQSDFEKRWAAQGIPTAHMGFRRV